MRHVQEGFCPRLCPGHRLQRAGRQLCLKRGSALAGRGGASAAALLKPGEHQAAVWPCRRQLLARHLTCVAVCASSGGCTPRTQDHVNKPASVEGGHPRLQYCLCWTSALPKHDSALEMKLSFGADAH